MQLTRAIILVEMIAIALLPGHARADTLKELNSIPDIYAAVRACWKATNISGPADLTVRLSFTRDGRIFGKAHVTYENRTVSVERRLIYRIAVMETFRRCTPLAFSPDLGDAIAGKPMNFRFRSNSESRS
jgi:hypothetical protein